MLNLKNMEIISKILVSAKMA